MTPDTNKLEKTEKSRISGISERGASTRWRPGQSGNPGGRPKGLARWVRDNVPPDRLAKHYLAIFERNEVVLEELGIDPKDCTLSERNKAGEWLTERGYGKAAPLPTQEIDDPLEMQTDLDKAISSVMDELSERRKAA